MHDVYYYSGRRAPPHATLLDWPAAVNVLEQNDGGDWPRSDGKQHQQQQQQQRGEGER